MNFTKKYLAKFALYLLLLMIAKKASAQDGDKYIMDDDEAKVAMTFQGGKKQMGPTFKFERLLVLDNWNSNNWFVGAGLKVGARWDNKLKYADYEEVVSETITHIPSGDEFIYTTKFEIRESYRDMYYFGAVDLTGGKRLFLAGKGLILDLGISSGFGTAGSYKNVFGRETTNSGLYGFAELFAEYGTSFGKIRFVGGAEGAFNQKGNVMPGNPYIGVGFALNLNCK
jgi:hypothetical protein